MTVGGGMARRGAATLASSPPLVLFHLTPFVCMSIYFVCEYKQTHACPVKNKEIHKQLIIFSIYEQKNMFRFWLVGFITAGGVSW